MPVAAADHSLFANSKWRDAVPPVHRQRTQCGRAGGGLRADIARQCTACAFKAACRRCRAVERTVSASSVHLVETGALTPSNQVPCPIVTATTAGRARKLAQGHDLLYVPARRFSVAQLVGEKWRS